MRTVHVFILAVIITLVAAGTVFAQETTADGGPGVLPPGNALLPYDPPVAIMEEDADLPAEGGADVSLPSGDSLGSLSGSLNTGRYLYNTYPLNIDAGTSPAVISRFPGWYDLFYFDGPNLNTSSKGQGDTQGYDWEGKLDFLTHAYSPAAFSENESHVGVFYVGGVSHSLYMAEWVNGAGWSDGIQVSGFIGDVYSTPSAVSRYEGNVELVYLNASDYLIHKTRTDGTWSAGEVIATQHTIRYGASLVPRSSAIKHLTGFTVYANAPYNNHVWSRNWNPILGWGDWQDTGMDSFSFVSSSVRTYDDGTNTFSRIDLITNATTGSDDFRWNVSYDGGTTWRPEPYTEGGRLVISTRDSVPVVASSRYNRVEFTGGSGNLWELIWRAPTRSEIGVYENGNWYLDANSNGVYNAGTDKKYAFGTTGWTPVTGDWDGDGMNEIGIYKDGAWYLDVDGDGKFDGGDMNFAFGAAGWLPVIGDYDRDGRDEVAIYRDGSWYIDYNGDGTWNAGDKNYGYGAPGWTPLSGQWKYNTAGSSGNYDKVAVFRDGAWYLDMNGNGAYDDGTDGAYGFGAPGWTPVKGDWNGDGTTNIGVYNNGVWYLDNDGSGTWNAGDKNYAFGGPGYRPVVGDWTADGITEIGVSNGGTWYLDYNGDGTFNAGDKTYGFGAPDLTPLIGGWI